MEHDADETMPIRVIGAIMGGMARQLGAGLEFRAVLFHHGIVNGEEHGGTLQGSGDTAQREPGSHSHPLEVAKSGIAQCIVKGIQGLIRKP